MQLAATLSFFLNAFMFPPGYVCFDFSLSPTENTALTSDRFSLDHISKEPTGILTFPECF